MDEQKKYEVIKALADHPDGNKDRAAMTLDCSKRHVNRMLKATKNRAGLSLSMAIGDDSLLPPSRKQPAMLWSLSTAPNIVMRISNIIPNCWQPMRTSISLLLLLQRYWKATASSPQRLQKPRKNA